MGKIASSGWPPEVEKELNAESERACVIVASAMIDQTLERLLKTYLVSFPASSDTLFDGPNAPMGNFSSKIDFSYRLGLISDKMCCNLHTIRKIRNDFAHDITGCTFESQAIKDRIFELKKSVPMLGDPKVKSIINTNRMVFQAIAGIIAVNLEHLAQETTNIDQKSAEWFYKVSAPKKKKPKVEQDNKQTGKPSGNR